MWNSLRLLSLCALFSANLSAEEKSEQPNFVIFLADDMGWGDSATYGHPLIKTPNLDKLASQGVKFTQCYAP
ncbi:sulfatase-like hydrolase/transferase, partial [Akkermansiaceae bacterium]|nr:sulfatase-like hydrolase/transferase [Akkermansiaceae bacterium]